MDDIVEQQANSNRFDHLKPFQYKKGQSGNPLGRSLSKGESLKEYAKRKLAGMTEEEKEEYFHGIDKKIIWEMAEGKADNKTDITSGGEKLEGRIIIIKDNGQNDNPITETDGSI